MFKYMYIHMSMYLKNRPIDRGDGQTVILPKERKMDGKDDN